MLLSNLKEYTCILDYDGMYREVTYLSSDPELLAQDLVLETTGVFGVGVYDGIPSDTSWITSVYQGFNAL